MPIKEALFWVGLAVFETGLFLCFTENVLAGGCFAVIGFICYASSVFMHHRPEIRRPSNWALPFVVLMAVSTYIIYYQHSASGKHLPGWVYAILVATPLLVIIASTLSVFNRGGLARKGQSGLVIHSATYGAGVSREADVMEILQKKEKNALAIAVSNDVLECEPAFGVPKHINVEYSFGNSPKLIVERPEGSLLVLPEDSWFQNEIARLKRTQQAHAAEFFESRSALRRNRHSIQDELENLGESFWVMWQVGHLMTQIAPEVRKKISKMILGNPNETKERLELWADASDAGTAENLRSRILDATRLAREVGTPVRWNNEQSVSVVIANPQSTNAGWIRIEYILPFLPSTSRPSIIFSQATFPALFATFVKTYEAMWNKSAEPPT